MTQEQEEKLDRVLEYFEAIFKMMNASIKARKQLEGRLINIEGKLDQVLKAVRAKAR